MIFDRGVEKYGPWRSKAYPGAPKGISCGGPRDSLAVVLVIPWRGSVVLVIPWRWSSLFRGWAPPDFLGAH